MVEACVTVMVDLMTLVLWVGIPGLLPGQGSASVVVRITSGGWPHSIRSWFACAAFGLLCAFSSCQAADVLLHVHAWSAGMGCRSAATTPAQSLHPSMPGPTAVAAVAAGLVAVAAAAVAVEVTAVAAGVVPQVAGHPVAGRHLGGSGRPRCPSLSASASW